MHLVTNRYVALVKISVLHNFALAGSLSSSTEKCRYSCTLVRSASLFEFLRSLSGNRSGVYKQMISAAKNVPQFV